MRTVFLLLILVLSLGALPGRSHAQSGSEPGSLRIKLLDGYPVQLQLQIEDAEKREVLRQIATTTGKAIHGIEHVPADARITLRFDAVALDTVLFVILEENNLQARTEGDGTISIQPLALQVIEIRELQKQNVTSAPDDPALSVRLEQIIALAKPAKGFEGMYAGDEIAQLARILEERHPPDRDRIERLYREQLEQIEAWKRSDAERAWVLANLADLNVSRGNAASARDLFGQARDLSATDSGLRAKLANTRALAGLGGLSLTAKTEAAIEKARQEHTRSSAQDIVATPQTMSQVFGQALIEPAKLAAEACAKLSALTHEEVEYELDFHRAYEATSELQHRLDRAFIATGNVGGRVAIWKCLVDLYALAHGSDSELTRDARATLESLKHDEVRAKP